MKGYVIVTDKRKKPIIVLRKVKAVSISDKTNPEEENNEYKHHRVKSKAKALKGNSMNDLWLHRFEEELQSIAQGINKKGGVQNLKRVYEWLSLKNSISIFKRSIKKKQALNFHIRLTIKRNFCACFQQMSKKDNKYCFFAVFQRFTHLSIFLHSR